LCKILVARRKGNPSRLWVVLGRLRGDPRSAARAPSPTSPTAPAAAAGGCPTADGGGREHPSLFSKKNPISHRTLSLFECPRAPPAIGRVLLRCSLAPPPSDVLLSVGLLPLFASCAPSPCMHPRLPHQLVLSPRFVGRTHGVKPAGRLHWSSVPERSGSAGHGSGPGPAGCSLVQGGPSAVRPLAGMVACVHPLVGVFC
jgi:hypothetical protein